jgi:hypothetical protein
MSAEVPSGKRLHLQFAGDACLMTAATFAVAIALQLGLFALLGSPKEENVLFGIANVVLMLLGVVAGVVLTWRLYGRRIQLVTVIGAVVGVGVAGPVTMLLPVLSSIFAWVLRSFTTAELAGPIALVVLVSAAFVALIVWLVVDTVRDMAPGKRVHVRLDRWRLVAVLVLAVYTAVVTVVSLRSQDGEMFEAIIFAMFAGIIGAAAVGGADLAHWLVERGKGTDPAVNA